MANKHVHAELAADEYAALLRASQKASLSTSEAVREATLAWVRNNFGDADAIASVLEKAASTERRMPETVKAYAPAARTYPRPPSRPS